MVYVFQVWVGDSSGALALVGAHLGSVVTSTGAALLVDMSRTTLQGGSKKTL